MHFPSLAVVVLATIPSIVSAFRLGDISNPIGDVSPQCDSQFNIPLMSCGRLPGKCSEACEQQLENLEKTLQDVCKRTKSPGGLLLVALNGDLVDVLCQDDDDSDDDENNSSPLKPTNTNTQLSFSGTVEASPTAGNDGPTRTGLVTDTSVPTPDSTETYDSTYAPTTLRTTSGPQSTQGSGDSDGSGGPFSSQEDNGAMAVRAGLLGVTVGVFAVIVNLA